MATIATGGFSLHVDGRAVPLRSVSLPSLPEMPSLPLVVPAATLCFRLGRITFADPVDRELFELAVLDRTAVRAMSPNELQEARDAAGREVLFDRLLSTVRLPRLRRG